MAANAHRLVSEAEYLETERASAFKHEYYHGEVFVMAGASANHVLIASNTVRELGNELRQRPCFVHGSALRVKIEKARYFTYPDVVVVCGDLVFTDDAFDTLLNLTVLIEVLSPSTEATDRGKKKADFMTIDMLQEYSVTAGVVMPLRHILKPKRHTLHGHFSRELTPALTIDPGDSVTCTTLDAGWGLEPLPGGTFTTWRKFAGLHPELDDGHALIGPIVIRGAAPDMTLEVRVQSLRTGAWGYCLAGGWKSAHNARLGLEDTGIVHAWTLDPDAHVGRNQHSHSIALQPFMGVMGMPPNEPGVHSTIPPRKTGGNLDCKELTVGSRLFLPIAVAGGLFSVGDGHAAQGHGELSGTAIECPMDEVELAFYLRDDFPVTGPVARTPRRLADTGFRRNFRRCGGDGDGIDVHADGVVAAPSAA